MTDDETWRLIGKVAIISVILAFKPQIISFAKKLGYREGPSETGWRRALKVVGGTLAVLLGLIVLATLFH